MVLEVYKKRGRKLNVKKLNIKSAGKSLTLAGMAVTVIDLLQPLAVFSAYAIIISLMAVAVLWIIKKKAASWHEDWVAGLYFFSGVLVLSCVVYFYQVQDVEAEDKGVLASSFTVVNNLQQSLGLVNERLESIDSGVAIISKNIVNVKKEVSSDPRKELANMGVSWSFDNFYESIYNHDMKVVELFLSGGMKLKSSHFSRYVHDDFSEDTSELLVRFEGVENSDGCPTRSFEHLGFYGFKPYYVAAKDEDRLRFVRHVCATDQFIEILDKKIEEESVKIQEVVDYNSSIDENIERCVRGLESKPKKYFLDSAPKFSMFGDNEGLSPREASVVGNIYVALLSGDPDYRRDPFGYVDVAINKACIDIFQEREVDSNELKKLKEVKEILVGA
ncbi:hypothetical protein MKP05_16365 [Halomonas sp. EGI 63088]|uniref:Uncharacterized protein n=1 Tax=Halomonas flagellata TaxID=2920385 RepID=A0ABS9RXY1_9GAMM|nr:hypothetical protein [Halomonas flagellata]MCH4564676.1 hypothetical protein [Halomonas flagellata]